MRAFFYVYLVVVLLCVLFLDDTLFTVTAKRPRAKIQECRFIAVCTTDPSWQISWGGACGAYEIGDTLIWCGGIRFKNFGETWKQ